MADNEVKGAAAAEPVVQRRIIFGDMNTVKFAQVIQNLERNQVQCEVISDYETLESRLSTEKFDICVVNLMFGSSGPFEMIRALRAKAHNPKLKIIVVTKQVQKSNVQNTLKAGAQDFVGEPFESSNLANRILYHLGPVQVIEATGFTNSLLTLKSIDLVRTLVESTELLGTTKREELQAAFFDVLSRLAKQMDSNRTSLIVVDEATNSGVVLASSDDASFYNFPISLDKYPEILHVMHTDSLIFIDDVSQNALTADVKQNVKTIAIASLMVLPVNYHGDLVGVLVIRRPNVTELPSPEAVRVLQAIANVMAAHANVAALLRKIYQGYKPGEAA